MEKSYSLRDVLACIKSRISDTFDAPLWVRAEVSECRENASGHCYLELTEKSEPDDEKIVAKARANIWANTFAMLKPFFEETAGMPLQPGMKVLVLAAPEFHEVFGLSLNIVDIDPTFTLGNIALQRDKILRRLRDEGVDEMNRELPLPLLLRRVAVVSSPTAAGYGDFVNQLQNNRYGYRFAHKLFPAKMQGEQTAQSIIDALDNIYADRQTFDVVVIIRGGGATSDLSAFDNYDLAYFCTQFPLPIVTGIGHLRDNTVLDLVAHDSLKTPTAVAEFLIESFLEFEEKTDNLAARIAQLAQNRTEEEKLRCMRIFTQLEQMPMRLVGKRRQRLENLWLRFRQATHAHISRQQQRLARYENRLQLCSLDTYLQKGFARIFKNGVPVRSAAELAEGDLLTIRLADGNVISKVIEK